MNSVPQEIVRKIEDKIFEGYSILQQKISTQLEICDLSFDLNSTQIAGQALPLSNVIKINPRFLVKTEHQEHVIEQTVFHEIAHLAAIKLFPYAKQSHGPEWRMMAVALGIPPVRCHSMVLDEVRERQENLYRFAYHCKCKVHMVSPTIHKRIQWGKLRCCIKCHSILVYLGEKNPQKDLTAAQPVVN